MKFDSRALVLVVAGFGLSPCSPTSTAVAGHIETRAQSPTDIRGIYVDSNALPISKQDSTALVASLSVPGVDGLVLVLGWKNIEPAKGSFDWRALDAWMNTAIATHKKVELSIRADFHTPSWLFQPQPVGGGATLLAFSFTRKPTDLVCIAESLAAPWDSAFFVQWDTMLDSVSTHLKNAGTYGTVVLLRLTGINKDSDELHLPALASGISCVRDADSTWLSAGYRPSKLLEGWDAITNSFRKHFGDKFFSVAIIASTNPFPPIAEDGSLITGPITYQSFPLLQLASQKFPGHLVIQNNSLYPGYPAESETVTSAESLHTMIAFQTNEDIKGKGAACGGQGDTTQCTDSTYLAELQTGIYPLGESDSLRARYIEVFALNVNGTPAAILQAHNELVSSPSTGIGQGTPASPVRFNLDQNFPNPFNPSTRISYQLPAPSKVTLKVYDLLGRLVATLVDGVQEAGEHETTFDARTVASGIYFCRLTAEPVAGGGGEAFTGVRRMVVMK